MAVPLLAAGIGLSALSGVLGAGRRREAARIQERIAGLQNQVFAEQYEQQRENLVLRRRQAFRQESAALAGSRVAAVASGSARSSSFGTVQNQIRTRTDENVGNINRALASGERLSGLNQRITELGGELSAANVPGVLETAAGTAAGPLTSLGIGQELR